MRSHYYWDRSGSCHRGGNRYRIMRDDDIGTEPDQLLGTIAPPVGIATLDLDVLTFRVAERVQTAPESISERMRG